MSYKTTATNAGGILGSNQAMRQWMSEVSDGIDNVGGGGGAFFDYSMNATTTAPPSAGQVRLNNADQTLATTLWAHDFDAPGDDVSFAWNLLKSGDEIIIQDKNNSAAYQHYSVSGTRTDNSTYWTVPITWLDGGTPVPTGQRCFVWMRSQGAGGGTTSPLTTKGDLWGYSTTDARVPSPGLNGKVLTTDTSQALGITWGPPTIGSFPVILDTGTYTYELAVADTVGSGLSNVMELTAFKDSDHTQYATVIVSADPVNGQFALSSTNMPINLATNDNIVISATGSTGVTLTATSASGVIINQGNLTMKASSTLTTGNVGANQLLLYAHKNGSNKMELRVKWPSGADAVLATEP